MGLRNYKSEQHECIRSEALVHPLRTLSAFLLRQQDSRSRRNSGSSSSSAGTNSSTLKKEEEKPDFVDPLGLQSLCTRVFKETSKLMQLQGRRSLRHCGTE